VRVSIEIRSARLRRPFAAAWGSVAERELVLLDLEAQDGAAGHGEAAPLIAYDGVSAADVASALSACAEILAAGDGVPAAELRARCARATTVPHALCAVDLALWDLAGRRSGEPVWRVLGAGAGGATALNYTIDEPDRAGAARAAHAARTAGFRCLKLKVGGGDDAGRLAAVRAAAGPAMAIRLDANGAWSPDEALATLRALAPAGLELCEEPVSGAAAIEHVAARAPVAVAMDESTAEPQALERRLCQAVCLKLGRCGGLTGLLEAGARARRAGYEVYVASALDGPLGIAAALHAAAVLAPDRPCGLATLGLFAAAPPPALAPAPELSAPPGAGLGDGLRGWYDAA